MRKVIVFGISIIIAVGLLPDTAEARIADSDGRVPVTYSCAPQEPWFGRTHRKWWTDQRGHVALVRDRIYINTCRLRARGAGPNDIQKVMRHEYAHAHGWEHWQGTPQRNAAYYPTLYLCHC